MTKKKKKTTTQFIIRVSLNSRVKYLSSTFKTYNKNE